MKSFVSSSCESSLEKYNINLSTEVLDIEHASVESVGEVSNLLFNSTKLDNISRYPIISSKFINILGDNVNQKDEQFRDKELKLSFKSVAKLRNELFNLQSSIVTQENLYKSILLSSKYMGNLFGSFRPFISGINKFTIRKRMENSIGIKNRRVQGVEKCNYVKYSMQWYLWSKRRNAELLSSYASCTNSLNNNQFNFNAQQLNLQKEIQNIEQSVKFRLALQLEKPLFTINNLSDSYLLS